MGFLWEAFPQPSPSPSYTFSSYLRKGASREFSPSNAEWSSLFLFAPCACISLLALAPLSHTCFWLPLPLSFIQNSCTPHENKCLCNLPCRYGGQVVNATLRPLHPRYLLHRKQGGPPSQFGGMWKREKSLAPTEVRAPNSPASSESQYQTLYTTPSGIYSPLLATVPAHKYTINLVECLVLSTTSSHKILQELDIYVSSIVCHILAMVLQ